MNARPVVPARTLVLVAALSAGACARRPEPPAPSPDVAIFGSNDVWDGDMGTTVTRAGFEHGAVYRFDSLAHRVTLPMGGARGHWQFALSPTDDRMAYVTYGADPPVTQEQKAVMGVRVVASDSSQVGWFPGCHSPCWSRDGTCLAMIQGVYPESNGWMKPVAVRVMDRAGRSVAHPFQPQRIAWANGDTLFLEFEDRVEGLDVARAKSWPTTYAGCQVSPDGEFSFRYRGHFTPFRVRRQAGAVELAYCVLKALGVDPYEPRVMSPFWVRSTTRQHLLCFTIVTVSSGTVVKQPNGRIAILDPAQSPPGQHGVRTVVFDPETFEVVHDLPGKVVAPANDHRSLVMLLGDTLSRARLPEWPPEPARPLLGRVHVQVYSWGSWGPGPSSMDLVTDSTVAVAPGDWLPGLVQPGCGERIRVAGMREDSRLELHLPAGLFVDHIEPNAGPHAARLLLGGTPVRLTTNSIDGGYDVLLSRVP